jgi:cytochrome c553
MRMRVRGLLCALALTGVAGIAAAQEAPSQARDCVACHGAAGQSGNPDWPNLAGQHAGYLALQLRAFRDGTRENAAMAPFVGKLSDRDIEVLADYYASLPRGIAANGDQALVAQGENLSGYCKACHGMQGIPVADEWPVLSGQQAPYLQKQLVAYKRGERQHSLMQAALSQLGEDDFAALAAYYSQLDPEAQ